MHRIGELRRYCRKLPRFKWKMSDRKRRQLTFIRYHHKTHDGEPSGHVYERRMHVDILHWIRYLADFHGERDQNHRCRGSHPQRQRIDSKNICGFGHHHLRGGVELWLCFSMWILELQDHRCDTFEVELRLEHGVPIFQSVEPNGSFTWDSDLLRRRESGLLHSSQHGQHVH